MYHYKVNIALKHRNRYYHWCSVDFGTVIKDDAVDKFKILAIKFPPADGWHLTLEQHPVDSYTVIEESFQK